MNILILFLTCTFLFGLIVGSFLNVLILRLPKNLSIGGRSHCPNCNLVLTWKDLFPVLSYLCLQGKCRQCRNKISPRYLYIELITGILFGLVWFVMQPQDLLSWLLIARSWLIMSVLIMVFVIDLEHFLILDKIVFPASVFILVSNIVVDLLAHANILSFHSLTVSGVLAGLVASGVFYLLWFFSDGKWMGFGDVKFMLLLGLALAWPLMPVGLFIAFVTGGILGSILLLTGQKKLHSKLPFGTFLSVGGVIALLFGQPLLHWYLGLIGLA